MDALSSIHDQGFALVKGAVDAALCEDINARVARFKQRNRKVVAPNLDEHGRLYRVVNLHLAVDAITRLLTDNKAIAACDGFFGEPASLYTSLYYERGSEQPLHRDTPVFSTTPAGRYLGVWVALDDVADDNGPLRVVPGSHALPNIDLDRMRQEVFGDEPIEPTSQKGWDAYQDAVRLQCEAAGLVEQRMHVERGDVIVWHPHTFHGGAPHPAPRTRRSVVMHVTPRDVPVGHMDTFFHPSRPVAPSHRRYYRRKDRFVSNPRQVDFGHEYIRPTWRLWKA